MLKQQVELNFEPRCLAYIADRDIVLVGGYSRFVVAISLKDFSCHEFFSVERVLAKHARGQVNSFCAVLTDLNTECDIHYHYCD